MEPNSSNLIYLLVGLVVGGVVCYKLGGYVSKLVARLEAWEAKEKAAVVNEEAHIRAIFTGVKALIDEVNAKAKVAEAEAKAVVENVEKAV